MVNFGIVGIGRWGKNYINNINDLKNYADTLLVCSRKIETYNSLKTRPCGIHHLTIDYKVVCEDPRINVVIVSTPVESHYEIVKYALENGKHVICEKPFVLLPCQAKELHTLAEKKNLCLVINYIHLWNNFYQKVKQFNKFNDLKSACFITENPRTNREHHSVFWDWFSHDFAMAYHLFDYQPYNIEVNAIFDGQGILKSDIISIDWSFNNKKCSFWLNTNSSKKKRSIIAKNRNDQTLQTFDTFDTNPLRAVIIDVINAVENKIKISNSKLAIKVTDSLFDFQERYK